MDRIGMDIVQESKKAILSGKGDKNELGQKEVGGRDLLSLLLKANLASDIPESQRLDDAEVLARTPHIPIVTISITKSIYHLYQKYQRT